MATIINPDVAREEIRDVARFADGYARALARETELHSLKGIRKSEAIVRLIGTPNAETDKPHSASSAEKVVESDATYAAFLAECRTSVVERIGREADYECAKLNARLAIALVTATNEG